MANRIAVSIINYINTKATIECIESLIKQDFKCFDIFLLDNNSPKDSLIQLKRYLKSITKKINLYFYSSDKNLGFGNGHNKLIKKAFLHTNYKYFLILNSDIVIDEKFLHRIHLFYT